MKDACLALTFGVCLVALFILGAEGALSLLPTEMLPEGARKTPPLVEPDQANIVYQKNGFRGKRPCDTCPDSLVRILTMGGSSTMGIPMLFAGRTYAAQLQRMLDERRPGERYEVLNGGVGGFGITQVYASLKEELLKFKPDIVTISCWFNDTAPSPGWYSIPGASDWEGYLETRRLAAIAQNPLVRFVRDSRLYAALRYVLLETRTSILGRPTRKKQAPRPRMNPSEFRQALEQIAVLAKEHDFLPVLITEAKNRTTTWEIEHKKNAYLKVLKEFSAEHQVPLVDSLTPLSVYRDQWLFYDFIHPNPAGHEIIAEAVYDELFASNSTEVQRAFLQRRGIDLSRPEAVQSVHLQLDREALNEDKLVLEARTPFRRNSSAQLLVRGDGFIRSTFKGLHSDFSRFEIPLSKIKNAPPIVDLFLEVEALPGEQPRYPIGNSGRQSVAAIAIKSGGKEHGWTVEIRIDGVRHDQNYRGYNAVVLGGESGSVLHSTVFDIYGEEKENERLAHFVASLDQFQEGSVPPIVVFAVKTDGRMNAKPDLLASAFRSLGGTGKLPEAFHSFALVGSPGLAAGTAVEQLGPRLISTSLGDGSREGADLLEVRIAPGQEFVSLYSGGVSFLK